MPTSSRSSMVRSKPKRRRKKGLRPGPAKVLKTNTLAVSLLDDLVNIGWKLLRSKM
jgi:hypothetical protein